jgi:hypothetical protein
MRTLNAKSLSKLKPLCSLILTVLLAAPQAGLAQVASGADQPVTRTRRVVFDPSTPPQPKLPANPALAGRAAASHLGPRAVTSLTGSQRVFLPLQAGFNLVSIPLRTSSQMLSDLFPTLPDGSEVWTWDAQNQQFVEGFDQQLPFGQACYMYLPMPALVAIAGEANTSSAIPVDLKPGWNLVGVPYQANLDLSLQTVYVDNVQTQFTDAMSGQAITTVASVATDGTVTKLGSSAALDEFKGYWMYSSGDNLLMLSPTLLGPGEASFGMTFMSWSLKSLGAGALGWGAGQLLNMLIPDATAQALAQIKQELDTILQGQAQIENELSALSTQLDTNTQEILQTIVDTSLVSPVRTDLKTHYDDILVGNSLAWFQQQAATPALAAAVTQQQKSDFANNVLGLWDFPDDFNKINTAIMGSIGSTGVIDTFANKIVLGSNSSTLIDRYKVMQAYFAELIGLQVKCGILIQNAYNAKATPAPAKGTNSKDAQDWYDSVFKPAIAQEYQYFDQVVERIAVSSVALASNPGDASVVVPKEVQVMLGYADYAMADALSEPDGMRVHVLINPDLPAPALNVMRGGASTATPVTGWRTVTGNRSYDSWGLVNNQRVMQITKNWQLAKINLTGYSSGDSLVVNPLFNTVLDALTYPVSSKLGTYDSTYAAATSGRVFGSVMVAVRGGAGSMLDPCSAIGPVNTVADAPVGTTSPASTGAPLKPCGQLSISGFAQLVSVSLPFQYAGNVLAPGPVTWQSKTWDTGTGFVGKYYLELWEGGTLLNQASGGAGGNFAAWQTAQNVQFTPGHSYAFTMTLTGGGPVDTTLSYHGAVIKPN